MSKEQIFKEHIEYATTDMAEVKYLQSCGIRYSFAKVVDGATIFKFCKTTKLFEALSKFEKYQ